jgi:hypothetical protein
MGANLAMAEEGTMVAMDGLSLSWPKGGPRQVVKKPHLSIRLKNRITNGVIVETDDPVTEEAGQRNVIARKLMTGDEAREYRKKPAGPVRRMQFDRETKQGKMVPIRKVETPSLAEAASDSDGTAKPKAAPKPRTQRKRTATRRGARQRQPAAAAPSVSAPNVIESAASPTEAREARAGEE